MTNVLLEKILYPFYDQRYGWDCTSKRTDRLINVDVLRNVFQRMFEEDDQVGDDGILFVCYEGVYTWDETEKDFVWVGEISKVVTKKEMVICVDDYCVYSGDKIIKLNRNETYTVRSESTVYFDVSEAQTTIVLKSERNDDTFEITYSESDKLETLDPMIFYEIDYGIISRVPEPIPFESSEDCIPF